MDNNLTGVRRDCRLKYRCVPQLYGTSRLEFLTARRFLLDREPVVVKLESFAQFPDVDPELGKIILNRAMPPACIDGEIVLDAVFRFRR